MENQKNLWKIFTAEEEYNPSIRDKYERFPFFLSQNRNVFQPSVSKYLLKNGLKPKYPDNKKFAICLTHDVDKLYDIKSLKQNSINAAKSALKLNFNLFSKSVKAIIKKEMNPNWAISKTLEIEKKYNAKSSFYFLSLTEHEEDFNYELSELKEIFEEIKYNKCEIGLHGGHSAYNNLNKIDEEKKKLESAIGKSVYGYRNHYGRFKMPTTWEYLDKLNFKYDTTFGYMDCAGFRNGMCHPFRPYTLNQSTFLDIVELPLIIMDNTLSKYMHLNEKEQFNLCKSLVDTVENNNGVLTFLWHNHMLTGALGTFYDSFLKYAFDKGAWITTANEMIDWWKENKYLENTQAILQQLKYEAAGIPDNAL